MLNTDQTPQNSKNYHNRSENQIELFSELTRLDALGFALHWILPNSKAPVESGWSQSPRHSLEYLKSSHRRGYGLGVVLGRKSQLSDGTYLANIDIDTKEKEAFGEALEALEEIFPGLHSSGTPAIKTGNGIRLLVRTYEPYGIKTIYRSERKTKVFMPTDKAKNYDPNLLTAKEFAEGWRIRPAFEISFLGEGAQAVLPPSIHPDTQKPYVWLQDVHLLEDIELLDSELIKSNVFNNPAITKSAESLNFQPVDYDLSRLQEKTIDKIRSGNIDNQDESSALFGLLSICWDAGYSEDEILSIFTDRENAMGHVAYRHAKTSSPERAAKWLKRYNLDKIINKKKEAFGAIDDDLVEQMLRNHQESQELLKEQKDLLRGKDGKFKRKKTKKSDIARVPGIEYNKQGKIQASFGNCKILLGPMLENCVAHNTMRSAIEYVAAPVWSPEIKLNSNASTQMELIAMKETLSDQHIVDFKLQTVFEVVSAYAKRNSFHPVVQELNNLPPWDGVPRVNTWLQQHFGAVHHPDYYTGDVFRKWLLASISRTYNPGTKFDWMIILEGPSGGGKNTFIQGLCGQDSWYCSDVPNIEFKQQDAILAVNDARIVHFEELTEFNRTAINVLKKFITKTSDSVRKPYERTRETLLRPCVFIGCTNDREDYINDDTPEKRRFCPIIVGDLDFDQFKQDRDQIWAEALHMYNSATIKEPLYLEGQTLEYAKKLRNKKGRKGEKDTMMTLIADHFSKFSDKFNYEKFKITDLFGRSHMDLAPRPLENFQYTHWRAKELGNMFKTYGVKQLRVDGYRYYNISKEQITEYLKSSTHNDYDS